MSVTTTKQSCPHCGDLVDQPIDQRTPVLICPNATCRKRLDADKEPCESVSDYRREASPAIQHDDRTAERIVESRVEKTVERPVENTADEHVEEHVERSRDEVDRKVEVGDEERAVVAVHRPVMFRRYPFRFTTMLLILVAGLVTLIVGLIQSFMWLTIIGAGIAILASVGFLRWWLKISGTCITVLKEQLHIEGGSNASSEQLVDYSQIERVDIYQPWLCRWLRSGAIEISWGDAPNETIYIDSISHPHELAESIRDRGIA